MLMRYANEVTPTLVRSDAALASALRMSVLRLARRLRSERADTSLSLTQLATLATLERHGAMSLGELAAHERVQPPSMTRVVACLEQLGLVTRDPHPSDRRQGVLAISAAGRALLVEDRRRRDAWLARQLKGLSPQEREMLRAALPVLERLTTA